jgi:hypothetical protein
MPFISLNGDILNSQFHIPGAWSNVLNLQNVSGELNNTPLFGNNAGSVSTPTSIDIYRVDGDAATPDVKGRHILYLVNNAGSPTTNFLNGVEGQEITIVAILTAASVIQNNANILLNGSANFSMDTGDTLTLLYVAGKWYEKSRSVH